MPVTAEQFGFRTVKPEEIDIFVDILERAATWMVANKLNQWYPGSFVAAKTHAHIKNTIAMGNAYFIVKYNNKSEKEEEEEKIIGTFTLNYDDPFDEMLWKDLVQDWTDGIYLHRLVVEREYKGFGLGPKALYFAEQMGLRHGKKYLRLDCMADNKLLKAYYREKAHFKEYDDYPGERLFGRFERPITATL